MPAASQTRLKSVDAADLLDLAQRSAELDETLVEILRERDSLLAELFNI